MCVQLYYERFAAYLAHFHESNRGALALSTVVEYVRKLINLAKTKFGAVAEHKPFFVCLDVGDKGWLNGVLARLERLFSQRAAADGTDLSSQATPVLAGHLRDVSRACAQHGQPESLLRRLVLMLTWCATGRASEIATLSWNQLSWDALIAAPMFVWNQLKTSKQKQVLLLAGPDRFTCVFKLFGDVFATGYFSRNLWSSDENNFVFPVLAAKKTTGTTLGDWLKAFAPGPQNTNVEYQLYRIATLPIDVTAAGIRVGAINTMYYAGVSLEMCALMSGHDLTGVSALFEYIIFSAVALLAGESCYYPRTRCTSFHANIILSHLRYTPMQVRSFWPAGVRAQLGALHVRL